MRVIGGWTSLVVIILSLISPATAIAQKGGGVHMPHIPAPRINVAPPAKPHVAAQQAARPRHPTVQARPVPQPTPRSSRPVAVPNSTSKQNHAANKTNQGGSQNGKPSTTPNIRSRPMVVARPYHHRGMYGFGGGRSMLAMRRPTTANGLPNTNRSAQTGNRNTQAGLFDLRMQRLGQVALDLDSLEMGHHAPKGDVNTLTEDLSALGVGNQRASVDAVGRLANHLVEYLPQRQQPELHTEGLALDFETVLNSRAANAEQMNRAITSVGLSLRQSGVTRAGIDAISEDLKALGAATPNDPAPGGLARRKS